MLVKMGSGSKENGLFWGAKRHTSVLLISYSFLVIGWTLQMI